MLFQVRATQCYKRWTRLLSAYKSSLEKMETTGKTPVKFQYFDLVHNCLEGRPKQQFPYVEESSLPSPEGISSLIHRPSLAFPWPKSTNSEDDPGIEVKDNPTANNVKISDQLPKQDREILSFIHRYVIVKEKREQTEEEARKRRQEQKEQRKEEWYRQKLALKEKKLEILSRLVAEKNPKLEERKRRREERHKEEMEMKAKKLSVFAEFLK